MNAEASSVSSVDQSTQRPGNIEQIQALRYTRDFLAGVIRGEGGSIDPERLYLNVSRSLGEGGSDEQLLAGVKSRQCDTRQPATAASR
jgi:hypothetical protein